MGIILFINNFEEKKNLNKIKDRLIDKGKQLNIITENMFWSFCNTSEGEKYFLHNKNADLRSNIKPLIFDLLTIVI